MSEISREAAARDLARLLAIARQHCGIPEPERAQAPAPAAKVTAMAAYLPAIIELYSTDATLGQIAVALGISRYQVANLITYARRRGHWPPELRRKPCPAAAQAELLPA